MARLNTKVTPASKRSNGLIGVIAELRKVTWPTFPQAVRLTLLVLAVSILLGVFFGLGVDNLFTWFISLIAPNS